LVSVFSIGVLAVIPVILAVAIPGFPNGTAMLSGWRKFHGTSPDQAFVLALVWFVAIAVFTVMALRAARRLVKPKLFYGTFEQVEGAPASGLCWIVVSGVRHCVCYRKTLVGQLSDPKLAGKQMRVKVGTGRHVVSIEVQEPSSVSNL
jgi:hypothetical protein